MELEELYSVIQNRIRKLPRNSCVASLYKQGEDAILQKIGEETTELILAAKGKSRKRIIQEAADLWFITLILLAAKNIKLKEIFGELNSRR